MASTYRYGAHKYQCVRQPEPPRHQCEECGRRFFTTDRLNHHKRNDHGPRIKCNLCDYTTTQARRHRMRDHERTHCRNLTQRPKMSSKVVFPPLVQTQGTPPQERLLRESSVSLLDCLSEWDGSPRISLDEEGELHQVVAEAMGWKAAGEADMENISTDKAIPFNIQTVEAAKGEGNFTPDLPVSTETKTNSLSSRCIELKSSTITSPEKNKVGNQAAARRSEESHQKEQTSVSTMSGSQTDGPRTDGMDILAEDPRFFFMGAPSSILQGQTAQLLRSTRVTARRRGALKRYFIPVGYLGVKRIEEAILPDGTVYKLTDFWTRDPECKRTRECMTQTESSE